MSDDHTAPPEQLREAQAELDAVRAALGEFIVSDAVTGARLWQLCHEVLANESGLVRNWSTPVIVERPEVGIPEGHVLVVSPVRHFPVDPGKLPEVGVICLNGPDCPFCREKD